LTMSKFLGLRVEKGATEGKLPRVWKDKNAVFRAWNGDRHLKDAEEPAKKDNGFGRFESGERPEKKRNL